MTAPEQSAAEKVAREIVRWRAGRDAWDELSPVEQERHRIEATHYLEFIQAAGLAVVEPPQPTSDSVKAVTTHRQRRRGVSSHERAAMEKAAARAGWLWGCCDRCNRAAPVLFIRNGPLCPVCAGLSRPTEQEGGKGGDSSCAPTVATSTT